MISKSFSKFDYKSYGHLLELMSSQNKNLCFSDFPLKTEIERYFILRHDVDFSPEAALAMAKFEASLGIKATYFLLLNSPHYNLLSKDYADFPSKLIALGHDVGLHYDWVAYIALIDKDPIETIRFQLKILSKLTRTKIKSISMHNPSCFDSDPFRNFKEVLNAYDDKFFKKIEYFSDSCGMWRKNTIKTFSQNEIPPKFQLLIHPIFWGNESIDRYEVLDNFNNEQIAKFNHEKDTIKNSWIEHDKKISNE